MKPLILAAVLTASMANADIEVTFRDGAPKDTFTIIYSDSCESNPMSVSIDLEPSPAGLIFDVSGAGAGVEVFQPFEVTQGGDLIVDADAVLDGDQFLTLYMAPMGQGDRVSFTIDLDDTGGGREITVSGAEIAGATVTVSTAGAFSRAAFDDTGRAVVALSGCLS